MAPFQPASGLSAVSSGGIAYPDASNVIDESLGSCCSLVVERFAAVSAPRREENLVTQQLQMMGQNINMLNFGLLDLLVTHGSNMF